MASTVAAALATVLLASSPVPGLSFEELRKEDCPLYPPYQDFKEPQATEDTHITLAVDVLTLCSPISGKFWKTRAYACTSCPDPSPAVPGVTILTDPGANLYVTHVNKLTEPDHTPQDMLDFWAATGPKTFGEQETINHVQQIGNLNHTSLHPHGLHTSPEREHEETAKNGKNYTYLPDTIFTHIPPGGTEEYMFAIRDDHMPGTHMYHPHMHNAAAVQAGGGMHGALIVRDRKGELPKMIEDMPVKVCVISLVDMRPLYDRNGVFKESLAGVPMLEKQGGGNLWRNLKGPDTGKYVQEDAIFALVNGMWRPKMKLITGHWYRFRFVFASVEMFIQAMVDSQTGLACEMQLLSKDGIWLHLAPRKVKAIYLASGNRADVAMSCECLHSTKCDGGLYSTNIDATMEDLSEKQKMLEEANTNPSVGLDSDLLVQELISFEFTRPSTGHPQGPLKQFIVNRPCYLVDLRNVEVPTDNQGRIDFWSPMDDPDAGWKVTYSNWYLSFKGESMLSMDAPPVFQLNVGEVYQFLIRGPRVHKGGIAQHPFHMHTIPYQINSLVTMDNFFHVGDWHDTFMHGAGQVVVKAHVDSYVGRYIIHCHILTHHDYGMMTYFDVSGKDGTIWADAEKVDPTCYRKDNVNPGYKWASEAAQKEDHLPEEPHWVEGGRGVDCHRVCVPFGGCNGMGWPHSADDMRKNIIPMTGSKCTIPWYATPLTYNPSVDMHGNCRWEFQSYIAAGSVHDGNYRCGKTPPWNVARICPCNKAPGHGWYI